MSAALRDWFYELLYRTLPSGAELKPLARVGFLSSWELSHNGQRRVISMTDTVRRVNPGALITGIKDAIADIERIEKVGPL